MAHKHWQRDTDRDDKIIHLITVEKKTKSDVARKLRVTPQRVAKLVARLVEEGRMKA